MLLLITIGDYTALWNYVDYPGIVFPTPIKAEKDKETYPAEYSEALSQDDAHVRQLWNESDFQGAPINLQLVSRDKQVVRDVFSIDALAGRKKASRQRVTWCNGSH